MATPLLEVGDRIGDHWTVEAVLTPKTFLVRCVCGTLCLHPARALLGPRNVVRSCGCQHPAGGYATP